MIPDKEIEKLALEKYPEKWRDDEDMNMGDRNVWIESYKAVLSNPDYVVIKREDIEILKNEILKLENKLKYYRL